MRDYRKNQKVIATLILEDKGQDFTESEYWTFNEIKDDLDARPFATLYIYFKDTNRPEQLPWECNVLNYKIIDVKKAIKPNRFK